MQQLRGVSRGKGDELISTAHDVVDRDSDAVVSVRDVTKIFPSRQGDVVALSNINWTMHSGEFVALIGPSGCGKTTLLNLVAGLASPSAGSVTYRGLPIKGANSEVGYMTQRDAVLPWRTVLSNVLLPLQLRGVPKGEAHERAMAILHTVELGGFCHSYPNQLSGGMKKRVGLAQTLVGGPEMVLLDEPFGALDAILKLALQAELMSMLDSPQSTVTSMMLVTHDLDEAITLADQVVILSARPGRIKCCVPIDLPRPRDPVTIRDTAAFHAIRSEVWGLLRQEIVLNEEIDR